MAGPRFEPKDPDFAARVRASFDRQAAMKTIGATLAGVEAGRVVIELPWAQLLTQQHGFLHAGAVTGILTRAEATSERVLELALGHGAGSHAGAGDGGVAA